MAAQGYLLTLNMDGLGGQGYAQFQNVSVRNTSDQIDTSSSINLDGQFNNGYSDVDGDLNTLFVDVDSVIKDNRVLTFMSLFRVGLRYEALAYEVAYEGQAYQGTGIYVSEIAINASIPGAAHLRFSFRSLQAGYDEVAI